LAKKKEVKAKPKVKVKKKEAKKRYVYDEKTLNKLGKELVDFVQGENIYHLCEWTESKGQSYSWWKELHKKYGILLAYHKRAKEILGNKILKNAFECNNAWAFQTFIPKYLGDVSDHLKSQEEDKLDRQMRFEKYKTELGIKSHDDVIAKIDDFSMSMDMMQKIVKYEKLLKENGLLDEQPDMDDV